MALTIRRPMLLQSAIELTMRCQRITTRAQLPFLQRTLASVPYSLIRLPRHLALPPIQPYRLPRLMTLL